jgi:hypothetical protein
MKVDLARKTRTRHACVVRLSHRFRASGSRYLILILPPLDFEGVEEVGHKFFFYTVNDAGTILLAIRAVRVASPDPVSSLLRIGDDATIPFWRIPNPVLDRQLDPDQTVLTDNPFGTNADTRDEYLTPTLPVGRIADFQGTTAQNFSDLIDLAARNRT